MVRALTQKTILATTLCAGLYACVPHVNQISTRNPDLFEKESDRLSGVSRGTSGQPAPEVYVRQRKPVVREKSKDNETGSLYSPDDERNYLFAPSGPHNVGRFLAINVVANRAGAKPAAAAAAPEAKPGEGDETEQELLKALPDLTPKAPGEPSLLKAFKMQIVHRYDNGDVLARMARRSQNEDQAAEITAEARIPYDKLASGDPLTTEDLLDVNYVESGEGELIERSSSGWEDEYSLRLSGFNEAKSKAAAELVDQKKQLEETKEKLETKIKAFGDERKQVAKQREETAKKTADADKKVKDLQTQVDDQKSTIDDQQKKIEQLSPADKPSDAKEGASGG